MADKAGFSRFTQLGASLTQRAQELSAKAAAEINKAKEQVAAAGGTTTVVGGGGATGSEGDDDHGGGEANDATATADLLQLNNEDGQEEKGTGAATALPSSPSGWAAAWTSTTSPSPSASAQAGASTEEAQAGGKSLASTAPAGTKSDVSKEELLEVLQKMNQKVKVLSLQKQQLTEQQQALKDSKDRLRSLIVDEILNGGPPELANGGGGSTVVDGAPAGGIDEVRVLQAAWRAQDEQYALALQQLQSEFQTLRLQQQVQQQQQQNGDRGGDAAAAAKEVEELREQVRQLQQQLNTATAVPTVTSPSSAATATTATAADDVQRVKDAAAAQIEALKKKFVVAHKNGVDKIKAEMQEAHRAEIDAIKAELKSNHDDGEVDRLRADLDKERAELQALREQQAAASSDAAEKLDELKASHASELQRQQEAFAARLQSELDKSRLEVEQSVTTEMEVKLQELLGEVRRKHTDEMARLKESAAADLSRKLAETRAALGERESDQVRQLQAQVSELSAQQQQALQSLRDELEASAAAQMADATVSHQAELENLRSAAALSSRDRDAKTQELEERLNHVMSEHASALESQRAEADAVTASRVEEVVNRYEAEVQQLRTEAQQQQEKREAEHLEERRSLRSTLEAQLKALKEQLAQSAELQRSNEVSPSVASSEAAEQVASAIREMEAKFAVERQEQREAAALSTEQAVRAARDELQNELDRIRVEHRTVVQDLEGRLSAARGAAALSTEQAVQAAQVELQKELERVRDEYSAVVQDLQVRLSNATTDATRTTEQSAQAAKEELQMELDRVRAEHRAVVQDLEKRLSTADAARRDSEERWRAANDELQHLKDALAESRAERDRLSVSMQEVEASSQQRLQDTLEKHQREHDQLVLELRNELQQARDLGDGASSEYASLRDEAARLKSQLTDMEDSKSALEKQLSDAVARAHEAEAALATAHETHKAELDELRSGQAADMQLVVRKAQEEAVSLKDAEIEQLKAEAATKMEEMRKSMEAHVDKMKAHFVGKLEQAKEASSSEIASLQAAIKDKDEKLGKLVDRLKSVTATTANLKNENEELKLKVDSELKLQTALRSEIQSLRRSMEETVSNSSATATSLLQQQENLEADNKSLRQQVVEFKTSREELSGKLQALTSNLNAMAEERNGLKVKLAAAAKVESKLSASESEVSSLREHINKLKLELTQNASLVSRLQAEKDATERNQGERAALVGMLENQISELNERVSDLNAKLEASLYDLSQKGEALESSEYRVRELEKEAEASASATKRLADALALAQKGAEVKTTKTIESLQKELQSVKQQMARKSAAAQKLLQEREAECSELKKANAKLQLEVESGSLSDRRIFELAAKQSNRESQQATEIEIRDKTIETMKTALLERDGELAHAETKVIDVESQVEELCRVRRREDVNLDYLKDIVVKYLSLPPGSSERARLLPVLATLLQFNAQDYQTIEEGKKVSWWGSVAPTLINAPDANESNLSGSAEVSVTRDPQARASTTSLQF